MGAAMDEPRPIPTKSKAASWGFETFDSAGRGLGGNALVEFFFESSDVDPS